MSKSTDTEFTVIEREHDLREEDVPANCRAVACDTETTGLDWRCDRLCTCQLWFGEGSVFVVKNVDSAPRVVSTLMASRQVAKVFHHALFDLRFLVSQWAVKPSNIMCTKIASKLLDPGCQQDHTLSHLLHTRLAVTLDKSLRVSDWAAEALSPDQLRYAANDVRYLIDLMSSLQRELRARKLWSLAKACFRHIPARVQLDLMGYEDVFAY